MYYKKLSAYNGQIVDGPLLVIPNVFKDDRGYFMESWNQQKFDEIVGYRTIFVQDNHSRSSKGVLRGMHYQIAPHAQGKLVKCIAGEIFDVAVDIRSNSDTYGKWVSVILSSENNNQLWIPKGFAHGFLALTSIADVYYKTTNYYSSENERSILWNDPEISISWPKIANKPFVSIKDAIAPLISSVSNKDLF